MDKPASSPQIGFSDSELTFIREHLHDDVNQLLLGAARFRQVEIKKLAGQILSRQKAAKKLPEWYANEALIFPPALSVEQCSSEATARFKSSLLSGKKLIDVTGGMGVDCYYMSHNFNQTQYFEEQIEVAATAKYNFDVLGAKNIEVNASNSLITLKVVNSEACWIYADPARRGGNQEKVVLLKDCTPDVVSNLAFLLDIAPDILLKTSPLLDIDLAAKELFRVKEVYVTGYENECKELLFHINKEHTAGFELKVRILDNSGQVIQSLDFDREKESKASVTYAPPSGYLYEPHAAVLKAGAFKILYEEYGVHKLAVSSHLYTSENLVTGFPGRVFQIMGTCKPDIKEILKLTGESKANLTLRNFPAKIHDLRKKWRLKEGGDSYLFGTTLQDQRKIIIVTKKLQE